MTRKQKHLLARIVIAAILFFAGSLFYLPEYMEAGIFLICYIVVGWDIVWKAITNILHGQVFDENFFNDDCHYRRIGSGRTFRRRSCNVVLSSW